MSMGMSLGGGALIGLAAVLMYGFNGRIMGVSGICSRLIGPFSLDALWRVMFLTGLIVGGWIYRAFWGVDITIDASNITIIIAGFCVGFGSVLGNGCTSGHGICGMARLSKRSIIATIVFMLAAMVTVFVKKMIGG